MNAARQYHVRLAFTDQIIDYVENYMGFTLLWFRADSPEELERKLIALKMEVDGALRNLEESYG
jgi:hypothetical protein